jgi:hypothetical protein
LTNITVIPGSALSAYLDLTNGPMMVASAAGNQLTPIADGAAIPSVANGTDWGGAGVKSGGREQVFTIYNVGNTPLDLTGSPKVAVTGADTNDFTVTVQPTSPVPPGGNTTFILRFAPSMAGTRHATVSIPRGDTPANPFDFAVQGFGLGGGAGVMGNDSEGVTWVAINDAQIHGNRFQSPRNMQIKELHAKLIELAGTFKCAVYADTNGLADRLLRSTVEVINATNGWNTFALTSPLDLRAGDYYWLVIWADTVGARVQYDSEGTSSWGAYAYWDLGGQWPDPISLTSGQNPRTYCIYAEGMPIGTVAGPAGDVRGNGKLIVPGDLTPSLLDGTDFGSLAVGSGARDQVFTIDNPGDTALELRGSPLVNITGPHAGDFTVTSPPISIIPPGGNTKFTVRFRPTVRGLRTATVSMTNNNPGANPYELAIQGAGYLTGRESIWPDTKTGKQWVENTDYELGMIFRASVPGKVTHIRVYAVAGERGNHTARLWRNDDDTVIGGPYTWNYGGITGWIALDIPDVDIEADTDYTVVVSTGSTVKNYANIAADVARGGNNGLHLSYPNNAGVFTTVLGDRPISSWNGGNYLRDIIFVPAGATVDLPDMNLKGNNVAIADGDTTPSSADGTDFGQTPVGGTGVERTFTIANAGNVPLHLSATPKVTITGAQANDFKVTAQPASPIAFGGTSSFTIRFTPTATGARNATVSIENDSDENPYDFTITGTGMVPAIPVRITEIKLDLAAGSISVRWEGDGTQFQVEKATAVTGPFQAVGAVQSERVFTDPGALKANAQSYYRVRRF